MTLLQSRGMFSFSRRIISVLAALAVFVVGASCTSAGCVLPGQAAAAAGEVATRACCGHRAAASDAQHSSKQDDSRSCPACHEPLFPGSTVAKSIPTTFDAPLMGAFLSVCPTDVAVVVAAHPTCGFASESPPVTAAPTLHALSCAFLN